MYRNKRLIRWIGLALLVLIALIGLDQRMIVCKYTVESSKIDQTVKLAVVADFHGCDYGEGASRLIGAIEEETPDVILLAGDIFDDVLPWDDSEALVRALAAKWPCYYVTGNHEYWSKQVEEICRIITASGATVLDQDCAELVVKGQHINLCGIPDPYANVGTWDALTSATGDIHQEGLTVLLAHRPELIEQYAAKGTFDLVVSGHAHGGQVRIPFLVNGLFAPNQGWFPKYAGGKYQVEGTTLIVSRGLARESTRLPRVFNRPELVMIELLPASR